MEEKVLIMEDNVAIILGSGSKMMLESKMDWYKARG